MTNCVTKVSMSVVVGYAGMSTLAGQALNVQNSYCSHACNNTINTIHTNLSSSTTTHLSCGLDDLDLDGILLRLHGGVRGADGPERDRELGNGVLGIKNLHVERGDLRKLALVLVVARQKNQE